MPRKWWSSNLFGGPAPFVGSQLPTFGQVEKAWIHYRMELESSNPGRKTGNRDVARRVSETAFFFFVLTFLNNTRENQYGTGKKLVF